MKHDRTEPDVLIAASEGIFVSVLGTVRATRRRLSSPQRWTRAALARDGRGRAVEPGDPRAVRWCLEGAIRREGTRLERERGSHADSGAYDTLNVIGAVLASALGRTGLGTLEREGLRPARPGPQAQAVQYTALAAAYNDAPGVGHREIAALLTKVDRMISRELRRIRQAREHEQAAPQNPGERRRRQ